MHQDDLFTVVTRFLEQGLGFLDILRHNAFRSNHGFEGCVAQKHCATLSIKIWSANNGL